MQERGLGQRQDDEHVHRDVVAQAGGADLVDDSHAPEDFHGARIAPFHLRQELRRFLLLDQRAAHPAHAEIDGERKTDRAAADDERLRVHRAYSALSISAYLGQNEENWTGGPQAAPTRKLPSPVSSKSPSRTARSQRAVRIRPPKQKKWTPAIGEALRRAMSLTTSSGPASTRSEEHTSELQSLAYLVCRLLLEKKKKKMKTVITYQTNHH